MLILTAEIFNRFPNIGFAFSTKIGLNRTEPFHCNLSLSVGDSEDIVLENRNAFYQAAGLDYSNVAMQKQVHEDDVRFVEIPGYQGESDAMYTNAPGIGLAVSTADCVPIFLYAADTKYVAAIHSGWRSTEKQICSKTVSALLNHSGANPTNIFAYIGPSISQSQFQVGPEVAEKFPSPYSYPRGEKFYLDIIRANKEMLIEHSIPAKNIQVTQLCSFTHEKLFHSYRRAGFTSGRAYGVIYLKN